MIARRDLLERLDLFDEGFRLYYEEDDLCHRARDVGMRVVNLPNVEVKHAWNKSIAQMDSALRDALLQQSFYRYFTKRYGAPFGCLLRALRRSAGSLRGRLK